MIKYVLADWIRISEILPWDIKSYLTHAILSRTHYAALHLGLHCLPKSTHFEVFTHFEVSGLQRLKLHHLWFRQNTIFLDSLGFFLRIRSIIITEV